MEKRELREEFIGRMDVLDKVGDLILLPSTEFATTEQVATYYGVTTRHIEDIISNNKEELISDGYGIRKADDFITELNFGNKVTKQRGKFLVEFDENNVVTFAPRGISLFPKRAILRVGMLLRDSEIAKEIRSRLLDIVHDAEQGKTEIIENIVEELRKLRRCLPFFLIFLAIYPLLYRIEVIAECSLPVLVRCCLLLLHLYSFFYCI